MPATFSTLPIEVQTQILIHSIPGVANPECDYMELRRPILPSCLGPIFINRTSVLIFHPRLLSVIKKIIADDLMNMERRCKGYEKFVPDEFKDPERFRHYNVQVRELVVMLRKIGRARAMVGELVDRWCGMVQSAEQGVV